MLTKEYSYNRISYKEVANMFKLMCRDLETNEVRPFSLEEYATAEDAAAALSDAQDWNDRFLECSAIWAESEDMTLA